MINYSPKHGDMEMWLIAVAIGGDATLIDRMKKNADGSYPIKFEVGGVELDFSKIAERIDEGICDMVKEKASKLLDEKYKELICELDDIRDRIDSQKNNIFGYEWE